MTSGDSKKYAEDVIEATIQAFKDRLPALDWLDEKSRKAAEEKASAITHKVWLSVLILSAVKLITKLARLGTLPLPILWIPNPSSATTLLTSLSAHQTSSAMFSEAESRIK